MAADLQHNQAPQRIGSKDPGRVCRSVFWPRPEHRAQRGIDSPQSTRETLNGVAQSKGWEQWVVSDDVPFEPPKSQTIQGAAGMLISIPDDRTAMARWFTRPLCVISSVHQIGHSAAHRTPKESGHSPIISTNPSSRTLPDHSRSSKP